MFSAEADAITPFRYGRAPAAPAAPAPVVDYSKSPPTSPRPAAVAGDYPKLRAALASLSDKSAGRLAPPPAPCASETDCASDPWPVRACRAILKGTGVAYQGFTVASATSALTFLMVTCLLLDPAAPDCIVIGDKSGKLATALLKKGSKPLVVEPQGTDLPCLSYKGFAEDIMFSKRWRAAYIMTPCDDDAMCGSQYFKEKVANHSQYWSLYLSVICWCVPADAVFFEHPISILHVIWRPFHQEVHPFWFGADDDGNASWKCTHIMVRGFRHLVATNLLAPPYFDYKHAHRGVSRLATSIFRSDMSANFCEAIAAQCNNHTIIEGTARPDLAVELRLLDAGYSKKWGQEFLPPFSGNLQALFPPVLNFAAHRLAIRAEAHRYSGRPVPQWPPTKFAHVAAVAAEPLPDSPVSFPTPRFASLPSDVGGGGGVGIQGPSAAPRPPPRSSAITKPTAMKGLQRRLQVASEFVASGISALKGNLILQQPAEESSLPGPLPTAPILQYAVSGAKGYHSVPSTVSNSTSGAAGEFHLPSISAC